MLYTVRVAMTIRGTADTFDASSYTQRLAQYVHVDIIADITLTTIRRPSTRSPARMAVIANITSTDASVAEGVRDIIQASNASHLATELQVDVETLDPPVLTQSYPVLTAAHPKVPSLPPLPSPQPHQPLPPMAPPAVPGRGGVELMVEWIVTWMGWGWVLTAVVMLAAAMSACGCVCARRLLCLRRKRVVKGNVIACVNEYAVHACADTADVQEDISVIFDSDSGPESLGSMASLASPAGTPSRDPLVRANIPKKVSKAGAARPPPPLPKAAGGRLQRGIRYTSSPRGFQQVGERTHECDEASASPYGIEATETSWDPPQQGADSRRASRRGRKVSEDCRQSDWGERVEGDSMASALDSLLVE